MAPPHGIGFNSKMPDDLIRYDLLAQDALRGVVRTVLTDVAARGLPGEHHFFIAFDTRADGVKISDRLRSQYPEEMTIVLQHQFWDLIVRDDGFDVGVSFNGIPERLTVPYAAIKGFFDPSVQFGLQFETVTEPKSMAKDAAQDSAPPGGQDTKPGAEPHAPRPAPRGAASEPEETRPARGSVPASRREPPALEAEPAPGQSGAQVLNIDKFRKK
jgi:hypothetical protein